MSLPFISVVVPAYNRPESLKQLLTALEEQSYPAYRFEVLVCDDGSTPPLSEAVALTGVGYALRFLRAENAGPASARNRGIREARGSLVAFTDDDCLPEPGWLEAIAEGLEDPQATSVQGPVHSSAPPVDPFVHSLALGPGDGVATANFAVKKDKLLAVGAFDPRFGAPYFEDEDLSRRLQASFGPTRWSGAMAIAHPPRQVPFRSAWRKAGFYRYLPTMQRKHPGYWAAAMPAVAGRVVLKSALVAMGALLVLSPSFGLAWALLAAWQLRRLQRAVKTAWRHQIRVPVGDQLAFLGFEWLLDFVRLFAYMRGLGLPPVAERVEEILM